MCRFLITVLKKHENQAHLLSALYPAFVRDALQDRIQLRLSNGLGTIPKMKTERFGSQPERSVFPVWVLTGFACCTARKSRSTHAVFCKCSYTCCACSSSKNRIDSNVCSCYNWNERLKKPWNAANFHWQMAASPP